MIARSPSGNCQSCGLPLRKDVLLGGTNADGTRNDRYCSTCYMDGRFTRPHLTAAEMQERVRTWLRASGLPALVAGLFTRGIPRLERWRSKQEL